MFYLMDTLKKHAQRLPDIVSNTRALQPSAQELNQLLQLQRDLLEKITLDRPLCALLDQLCKSVEQLIPNSRVAVMLLDQGTGYLNIVSAPGIPDTFHAQINRLTPGPLAAVQAAQFIPTSRSFAQIRTRLLFGQKRSTLHRS